jgi:hypothetical protein
MAFTAEEIRYYRQKAAGLIGRKYKDFAWTSDDAFEPQDYSLDARVRRENNIVERPAASLPYVGIISPYKPSGDILLDVRFNPQTNNVWRSPRLRPDNTCSCSSTDAFVNFFIPGATKSDDEYIERFHNGKYGDTTDHLAHVRCCEEEFGLLTEFRTDFTFDDLDAELEANRPVVIAFLHRGSLSAPSGGHVAVCRGKVADGSKYWVMDPYGSMNDGYMGLVENGRCAGYTRQDLNARWYAPPGYPKGGYVRIFKGFAPKKA